MINNVRNKIFDIKDYTKNFDYSAVPFCGEIFDNKVEVFFSVRDEKNRSALMSFIFNLDDKEVEFFDSTVLISHGELGAFDDSGVMGTDYIKQGEHEWIYYIGWNLGVTVPFRNSLGLAEKKENGKWEKLFPGPILDRTKNEPHFNASSCIINEGGIYKIWYLSCVKWVNVGSEIRHYYHIKYATSDNGIDWDRDGIVAIDFEDDAEYAISVPRVIKINGEYHMWFSSRATKDCDKYQIRHAVSNDGVNWNRSENPVLSSFGDCWESDMVCYPFILPYKNKLYMFYNGNDYGKSGIGLTEVELEGGL
ncbi:hypothetical protein [Vibrio splendidus]|uniref:hypothetical protein n=1 Tax=Vibrio splendidus TaxID=29497 RepID=UPI0024692DBD|nr:hypothetical protein [Vibrio splendidus]MDH5888516.1 hypothetical protein [Vibrio splendidus]